MLLTIKGLGRLLVPEIESEGTHLHCWATTQLGPNLVDTPDTTGRPRLRTLSDPHNRSRRDDKQHG
jgi:hypothetical protein